MPANWYSNEKFTTTEEFHLHSDRLSRMSFCRSELISWAVGIRRLAHKCESWNANGPTDEPKRAKLLQKDVSKYMLMWIFTLACRLRLLFVTCVQWQTISTRRCLTEFFSSNWWCMTNFFTFNSSCLFDEEKLNALKNLNISFHLTLFFQF